MHTAPFVNSPTPVFTNVNAVKTMRIPYVRSFMAGISHRRSVPRPVMKLSNFSAVMVWKKRKMRKNADSYSTIKDVFLVNVNDS